MKYSKIINRDIANGEGIRVSLFISGCNQHCFNCFNPEAQDFSYGENFTSDTFNEILDLVSKPEITGLSILGGEPLDQLKSDLFILTSLCTCVKLNLNKNIWLWSGHVIEDIVSKEQIELLNTVDVLIDGPYIDSQKDLSLAWRGSKNQRVIDVNKSKEKKMICLYSL